MTVKEVEAIILKDGWVQVPSTSRISGGVFNVLSTYNYLHIR